MKTDNNVPKVRNKQKKLIFGILKDTAKKSRIRIRNLEYGSKDPDPDPYQNVTDPEYWVPVPVGG
jgi:hypothetical protein